MNKPSCQLSGTDGNVYAIIGAVTRSLKESGQHDKAAEWKQEALNAESYGHVLMLAHDYVEVL